MEEHISDPVLGALVFDERLNWYEGNIALPDQSQVRLVVSLNAHPTVETAMQEARYLAPVVANSIEAAKAFACDSLLQFKNDGWLEDGESPVSREAFMARMQVESIGVYAERECEVFFADGDLFWGHTILLSWNPSQGFYGADIAG